LKLRQRLQLFTSFVTCWTNGCCSRYKPAKGCVELKSLCDTQLTFDLFREMMVTLFPYMVHRNDPLLADHSFPQLTQNA